MDNPKINNPKTNITKTNNTKSNNTKTNNLKTNDKILNNILNKNVLNNNNIVYNTNNKYLENRLQNKKENNRNFLEKLQKSNSNGIGHKIKSIIYDEFNQIIFVGLAVLLVVLVLVLYYYTFSAYAKRSLVKINYQKDLNLQKMPTCNLLDDKFKFFLCDYYIASSYNTICVNKPHFDYVSLDIIKRTLLAGARYIQIPICSEKIGEDGEPVVATSVRGKSLITSLNTLDFKAVFNVIKNYAFRYIDNSNSISNDNNLSKEERQRNMSSNEVYRNINYPLFIHLQINTYNLAILNKAYHYIESILGNLIIDVSTYHRKPIALEKMCLLLNKIIIIATPGYEQSELRNIIVPSRNLFQIIHHEKLIAKKVNKENEDDYYENLSFNKAKKTYQNTDNLGQLIGNILKDTNMQSNDSYPKSEYDTESDSELDKNDQNTQVMSNSGDIILENKSIMDRLTIYNMVGLTLVEPIYPQETNNKNYNPYLAFTNGCQFISMNYQINDKFMSDYINVFKKSSCVLKPSGLRLPIYETDLYETINSFEFKNENIKPNIESSFISQLNKRYIVISELTTNQSKILTNDLQFTLNYKYNIDNILDSYNNVLKKSDIFKIIISPLNDNTIILVSAKNEKKALTINTNVSNTNSNNKNIIIDNLGVQNYKNQSFYPVVGLTNEGDKTISFRYYSPSSDNNSKNNKDNINNKNNNTSEILYLGINNARDLMLLPFNKNAEKLTFNYQEIPVKTTVKIKSDYSGFIKIFGTGSYTNLKLSFTNNEENADIFILKKPNFNYNVNFKQGIHSEIYQIKSLKHDKYLINTYSYLSVTDNNTDKETLFLFTKVNDYYKIQNINGFSLIADGIDLKFKKKTNSSKIFFSMIKSNTIM